VPDSAGESRDSGWGWLESGLHTCLAQGAAGTGR